MIYVRPFKKEDFLAFEPLEPLVRAEIENMELAQAIEESELAVSAIRDDKVVGCGGVHPIENSNHGEMWLRISKDCLGNKIESVRFIKEGLKIIGEICPFDLFYVSIKSRFTPSIKLAKRLGFIVTRKTFHEGENWITLSKDNYVSGITSPKQFSMS